MWNFLFKWLLSLSKNNFSNMSEFDYILLYLLWYKIWTYALYNFGIKIKRNFKKYSKKSLADCCVCIFEKSEKLYIFLETEEIAILNITAIMVFIFILFLFINTSEPRYQNFSFSPFKESNQFNAYGKYCDETHKSESVDKFLYFLNLINKENIYYI